MNDEYESPFHEDELPSGQSAVDEKALKRAENQRKREIRESKRFWREVLGSEAGRRELWLILTDAKTFNTEFGVGPNGAPQPEMSYYNLGQQQFGLGLYHKLIERDPDATALMLREHHPAFQKPKGQ